MTRTWTNEYSFHHKDLWPSGAVTLGFYLWDGRHPLRAARKPLNKPAFRSPASDLYEACSIDQATLRVYDATGNNTVLWLLMLYAFISPLFWTFSQMPCILWCPSFEKKFLKLSVRNQSKHHAAKHHPKSQIGHWRVIFSKHASHRL